MMMIYHYNDNYNDEFLFLFSIVIKSTVLIVNILSNVYAINMSVCLSINNI